MDCSMEGVSKRVFQRKVLSLEDKVNVIRAIESGAKKVEVCRKFGLVNSTVCTIWNSRDKVLSAVNDGQCGDKKRMRKADYDQLDQAMLRWFKQQRTINNPISGPIMKAQGNLFGQLLGLKKFKASDGWLNRFKLRHNIVFGEMSEDASDVDCAPTPTTDFSDTTWPQMKEGYVHEIFNSDWTRLFYKVTPDKTFKFKKPDPDEKSKTADVVSFCTPDELLMTSIHETEEEIVQAVKNNKDKMEREEREETEDSEDVPSPRASLKEEEESEEESEEEEEEEPISKVTLKEALEAARVLSSFSLQTKLSRKFSANISQIEAELEDRVWKSKKAKSEHSERK